MDDLRRSNVLKELDDFATLTKIALMAGHEHGVRAQRAKRVSQ
jgi:hypothetical protein